MRLAVGNPAKNKVQNANVASTTDLRPIVLMLIATNSSVLHCATAFRSTELLALNRTAEKRDTDA